MVGSRELDDLDPDQTLQPKGEAEGHSIFLSGTELGYTSN